MISYSGENKFGDFEYLCQSLRENTKRNQQIREAKAFQNSTCVGHVLGTKLFDVLGSFDEKKGKIG